MLICVAYLEVLKAPPSQTPTIIKVALRRKIYDNYKCKKRRKTNLRKINIVKNCSLLCSIFDIVKPQKSEKKIFLSFGYV